MKASIRRFALPAVALVLGATVSRAQETTIADGRLNIHGYLTQGYAKSDGTPFYGIRDEGSTDFRYAALQFRYDRGQDGFLVQVNHRRLGESPITDFESSVNLNWAFYQRSSKDGSSAIKIGRIPVPRGIYNEQRSIGVILPMYRAPVIFYDEGAYFSETIDGAVANHTFNADGRWTVDANLYGGGWSLLQYDQSGDVYAIGRVRAENAIGTQLWLNTPVDGLRLGVSGQRYHWKSVDNDDPALDWDQDVWEVQGSLDASFSRAMLRAETELQKYETDDYYASYVQLGAGLTRKLWVYGLAEYAVERDQTFAPDLPGDFDWHRAAGVALNYRLTPTFVLKAEHHWNKGIQVEQPADPLTPPKFQYTILSASASF